MVMYATKYIAYKQAACRLDHPTHTPVPPGQVNLVAIMRCVPYLERAGAILLLPGELYSVANTKEQPMLAIAGGIAVPHTSPLRAETI